MVWSGYDVLMLDSNFFFLIPAVVFEVKKKRVISILSFLVFIFSTLYHIYYYYEFYNNNRIRTFILLLFDVFFAALLSIAVLILLLPHYRHKYEPFHKNVILVFSGLIIIYVEFISGWVTSLNVEDDNYYWIMIAMVIYYLFMYFIFTLFFVSHDRSNLIESKLNNLRNFYTSHFKIYWLLIAFVFMIGGLVIWIAFQSVDYDIMHPFWHIFIAVSATLIGISLKQ